MSERNTQADFILAPSPEATLLVARGEAFNRYDGDRQYNDLTGQEESFDDWGYSECERRAFIAGVEWLLGQDASHADGSQ